MYKFKVLKSIDQFGKFGLEKMVLMNRILFKG